MFEIFLKGGPIMWPLLITSIVTLAVVLERLLFLFREKQKRKPEQIPKILEAAEAGELDKALSLASENKDYISKVLKAGLQHRERSFSRSIIHAAQSELKRFNQRISVLDTAITLAPLLGLLGTVTGLIRSFRFLGNQELGAPTAITGGIAEALIATAFGLAIAITALIPFNYLNAKVERAQQEIEEASTELELALKLEN